MLRVNNGLGTLESELGALGMDWRAVLRQKAREKKMMDDLGLVFGQDASSKNMMNAASGTPSSTGDAPRSAVDEGNQ